MSKNSHYFINRELRAEKAKGWTDYCSVRYKKEIEDAINATKIYGIEGEQIKNRHMNLTGPGHHTIYLEDCTTEEAIYKFRKKKYGKVAVLNFASYKNPGGMFLKGSSAQEESLCHVSILFNVLRGFEAKNGYYNWNRKHTNDNYYENRALYTPNVLFLINDKEIFVDVITCAAPNLSAQKGNSDSKISTGCLFDRLTMIYNICCENHVDTFITGAWGCGVFGNEPTDVSILSTSIFDVEGTKIPKVVYAIPKRHGRNGEPDMNYTAFENTIESFLMNPLIDNEDEIDKLVKVPGWTTTYCHSSEEDGIDFRSF